MRMTFVPLIPRLLFFFALGMLSLHHFADAALAEEGEKVSIRVQRLPLPTDTDVAAVAARAVIRAFLEKHPEYEIEAVTMPLVGGGADFDVAALMAISAGVPPHGIYVNFRQSSTYISQGFLTPLEILLARVLSENETVRQTDGSGNWLEDPTPEEVSAALEEIRTRVPALTWPVIYRDDDIGGGKHVWAMPYQNLVAALFYRKDLFFDAGLDPARPPETWNELIAFAQRLRVPERRQYGMQFASGIGMGYSTYNFFVSNNARAIVKNEEGQWRAAFDSREAAETVHFLWRLIHEPFERDGETIRGAVDLTTEDLRIAWERGKVGMQFNYLSEEMLSTINPQLVGIAPLPQSPRGAHSSELNARMLGVFSDSTPAQQLAVMRYIWFRTSEEAQRIRTRIFVENGFGQFVNPDMLEKFGYDRLLHRVPSGWREAFQTAITNGVPEPYGRNTQFIYRWLAEPINRVLEHDLHGLSDEEAVDIVQEELIATVQELNSRVLSDVPPEEMKKRRLVGGMVLGLMATIFLAGFAHTWRYFSRESRPVNLRSHWRRYAWGFVLVTPGLALVLLWQYLPLAIGGMSIAFMDYRVVLDSVWVGVDNFANVLYDERFWSALWRSVYFVALAIGLGFWPPILLAILLHEVPTNTAKYIYRTIFYLPSVLVGVVVMFLWHELYDGSSDGVLNQLLLAVNYLDPVSATIVKWVLLGLWGLFLGLLIWLPVRLKELAGAAKGALWLAAGACVAVTFFPLVDGFREAGLAGSLDVLGHLAGRFQLEPLRWVQSPELAMLCIVIPMVWATSGPGCIIYLAALKGIPDDLYEAADIDGASHWHKVFYIVLPRLKYLIVIQFLAAVIAAFKGAEEYILVMTGGGPGNATTVLSLEIFFRTFMDLEFGLGTAMAWLMGALLIGFTAYQLKLLSKAEFRAGG